MYLTRKYSIVDCYTSQAVSRAKKAERKLHVYGKRQTSDSSWEFLKIENVQIKTAQNNSYG